MDQAATRTAFLGLIGGFVLYAFSTVALYVLPDPLSLYVSSVLIVVAMAFGIGWFIAVRRGWRLGGGTPRSAKRRKDRERPVSPWRRR